jgi:dienelactone hydrolase
VPHCAHLSLEFLEVATRYAAAMELRRDDTSHGVRERVGSIVGSLGEVPLALWTPESAPPERLVLIGHGASGTKLEGYVVALARTLVRRHGCAALAIDGPVHGDRRRDGAAGEALAFLEFAQRWSSDEGLTDAMVDDWRTALDWAGREVLDGREVPVGYWGLSMGTIFGLPLVAAEPRIAAAVLGLMGVSGPTRERLSADAARVRVPTLLLVQWDDQLVAREDAFALFGRLGATDKTMIVTPGAHADVPAESFAHSAQFLVERLDRDGPPGSIRQ